MRNYLLTILLLFSGAAAHAQEARPAAVEMTASELASLARKIATLRARRVALYRQRQAEWQRYHAERETAEAHSVNRPGPAGAMAGEAPSGGAGERGGMSSRRVYDTLRTLDEQLQPITYLLPRRTTPAEPYLFDTIEAVGRDFSVTRRLVPRLASSTEPLLYDTVEVIDADFNMERYVVPYEPEPTRPTPPAGGLEALQRRMDRQEAMLRELLDRAAYSAPPAAARRDTFIERVISSPSPDALTRTDLNRLTDEIRRLNEQVRRMEDEVAYQSNQRRRAEAQLENALVRQERRDIDNLRSRSSPNLTINPALNPPPAPAIVRDTVFVDRPATAPARVDTVRETVRVPEVQTVRDTLIQVVEVPAEPVVRQDTVRLEAREPIAFPTVFFDNNSSTLNTNHRNIIATLVGDLDGRPGYLIRLTGYASKSGSAAYNQELSAKRAEAVRQGLLAQGVAADRIRVVAGGIDFGATTPAAGRRVEILALPQ